MANFLAMPLLALVFVLLTWLRSQCGNSLSSLFVLIVFIVDSFLDLTVQSRLTWLKVLWL